MDASTLIAKLLAVVYFSVGLGLFFNRDYYLRAYQSLRERPLMLYFFGIVALVVGTLIISFHNLWVADWRVLITVIGWIGLVKGFSLVVFPKQMLALSDKLTSTPGYLRASSVLATLLGVFFLIYGFCPRYM